MNFFTLFFPFVLSLLIALVSVPLTIKFANKFKLVDDPKTHKHPAIIHKSAVPRAGGLPIYIAVLISSLFLLQINFQIGMILLAGLGVVIVGLFDDRYDLSPYIRFATNIVFAGVVVFSGITIPFVTNPLGGILQFSTDDLSNFFIPQLLAIVWIVWVMNMLNWSKGVDGQMPGIATISAIVIGIAALRFPVLVDSNITVAELAFITAGAALGFLVFNLYPAKIFPGYSATILGFLIGILSILSGVKLATAILVMGIPTADALFTILRRTLSKKSPFWHDKGHLHHILLQLGLSQRAIAVFYWSMSAILGVIALTLSSKGKLFAIILLVVLVTGGILSLKYITRNGKNT